MLILPDTIRGNGFAWRSLTFVEAHDQLSGAGSKLYDRIQDSSFIRAVS